MNFYVISTVLFFVSIGIGQLGGFVIFPGVTVYLFDIAILPVLIGLYSISKNRLQIRTRVLLKPIIFVLLSMILSLVVNALRLPLPQVLIGSLYFIRWALYACLYILIIQNRKPVFLLLMKGLYAAGVAISCLGLIQYVLYPDLRNLEYLGWDPHYYRVFSTILDPNFAGIMFVFTVFLGFYFYLQRKRVWILGATLIPFIALVLTFSRSSYLAFFIGAVAFALLENMWKQLAVSIIFFFVLFFAFPNPGRNFLHMDRMATSVARLENWQESLVLIKKSPVFGYGFNTLRYIQEKSSADGLVSHAGAGVDNSFLFLLATTGIIGFSAYIWLLVSIIRSTIITSLAKDTRVFGHMALATLLSVFVHSQFVNSLFFPQVMIWMWVLVGVVELKLRDASLRA